jgi:hypothetical protein
LASEVFLVLQDPHVEKLLHELTTLTGEDPVKALCAALAERLARLRREAQAAAKQSRVDEELWGY